MIQLMLSICAILFGIMALGSAAMAVEQNDPEYKIAAHIFLVLALLCAYAVGRV